jgi:hypothetical protein
VKGGIKERLGDKLFSLLLSVIRGKGAVSLRLSVSKTIRSRVSPLRPREVNQDLLPLLYLRRRYPCIQASSLLNNMLSHCNQNKAAVKARPEYEKEM